MTLKEEFLQTRTYWEYEAKKSRFDDLEFDGECMRHLDRLFKDVGVRFGVKEAKAGLIIDYWDATGQHTMEGYKLNRRLKMVYSIANAKVCQVNMKRSLKYARVKCFFTI